MIEYDINNTENVSFVTIRISDNDSVYLEPGYLNSFKGRIEHISIHNLKNSLNCRIHGNKIIKDIYKGNGTIYLKQSKTEVYHRLLTEGGLLIHPYSFLAASEHIALAPFKKNFFSKLVSGVELVEPEIVNKGEVILRAPGKIEKIDLNNEEFVSCRQVVARDESITVTTEVIGDKRYYSYRGHGSVYAVVELLKDNL